MRESGAPVRGGCEGDTSPFLPDSADRMVEVGLALPTDFRRYG